MKLIFDWIKSKFYNSDFVRFENFQQRFALKKKNFNEIFTFFGPSSRLMLKSRIE